jgi:hypothetical protein
MAANEATTQRLDALETRTKLERSVPSYGPEGAFITGSDLLMDGGVTAAYWLEISLRNEESGIRNQESGIRNQIATAS